MKIFLAYIPVLHQGYYLFFQKHPSIKNLYLVGQEISQEFKEIYKDIRTLDPNLIKQSLLSWKRFKKIEILNTAQIKKLQQEKELVIVTPNEDLSQAVIEQYFSSAQQNRLKKPKNKIKVEYDAIFLRWDKHLSQEKKTIEKKTNISEDNFEQKMMKLAFNESIKSPDWWRQIAALVIQDKKVILKAYNQHVPGQQQSYFEGDPRNNYTKGMAIELSIAHHAEAALIAKAAKKGIKLDGAEILVTTFPCPVCAKQIAAAGIKKLYYAEGYSILDAERILHEQGVEIIQVELSAEIKKKIDQAQSQYSHLKHYQKF